MLKLAEITKFELPFHAGNHLVQCEWFSIKFGFVPRPLLVSEVGNKTELCGLSPFPFRKRSMPLLVTKPLVGQM